MGLLWAPQGCCRDEGVGLHSIPAVGCVSLGATDRAGAV